MHPEGLAHAPGVGKQEVRSGRKPRAGPVGGDRATDEVPRIPVVAGLRDNGLHDDLQTYVNSHVQIYDGSHVCLERRQRSRWAGRARPGRRRQLCGRSAVAACAGIAVGAVVDRDEGVRADQIDRQCGVARFLMLGGPWATLIVREFLPGLTAPGRGGT